MKKKPKYELPQDGGVLVLQIGRWKVKIVSDCKTSVYMEERKNAI